MAVNQIILDADSILSYEIRNVNKQGKVHVGLKYAGKKIRFALIKCEEDIQKS